jgi:hypothetical protein
VGARPRREAASQQGKEKAWDGVHGADLRRNAAPSARLQVD